MKSKHNKPAKKRAHIKKQLQRWRKKQIDEAAGRKLGTALRETQEQNPGVGQE